MTELLSYLNLLNRLGRAQGRGSFVERAIHVIPLLSGGIYPTVSRCKNSETCQVNSTAVQKR